MVKNNKLLSTAEAAALIINAKTGYPGITPGRVLHMIHSGLLPATKKGRDWIITFDDVKKLNKKKRFSGRKIK